jgi:hypothetical protein
VHRSMTEPREWCENVVLPAVSGVGGGCSLALTPDLCCPGDRSHPLISDEVDCRQFIQVDVVVAIGDGVPETAYPGGVEHQCQPA